MSEGDTAAAAASHETVPLIDKSRDVRCAEIFTCGDFLTVKFDNCTDSYRCEIERKLLRADAVVS